MPVPWISPVCMIRPSESANVNAPGAARRLNTDSRATYSMSMKRGSVNPHRLTNVTMSVSETVRLSVRNVAPTLCCSKVNPSLLMGSPFVGPLEHHDPDVRVRRVAGRGLAPPVLGLPLRQDVRHTDAGKASLIALEPAENRPV